MQGDETEDRAGGDRDFVASLEKGLMVIEAFDAGSILGLVTLHLLLLQAYAGLW